MKKEELIEHINYALKIGADVTLTEEDVEQIIKALKQNRWIPCSERLPKKDEEVFVYLFRKQPYIAWHNGVDWCTNDFTVDKDDEPLAWMPLPQPYRAESEEKE